MTAGETAHLKRVWQSGYALVFQTSYESSILSIRSILKLQLNLQVAIS